MWRDTILTSLDWLMVAILLVILVAMLARRNAPWTWVLFPLFLAVSAAKPFIQVPPSPYLGGLTLAAAILLLVGNAQARRKRPAA